MDTLQSVDYYGLNSRQVEQHNKNVSYLNIEEENQDPNTFSNSSIPSATIDISALENQSYSIQRENEMTSKNQIKQYKEIQV